MPELVTKTGPALAFPAACDVSQTAGGKVQMSMKTNVWLGFVCTEDVDDRIAMEAERHRRVELLANIPGHAFRQLSGALIG